MSAAVTIEPLRNYPEVLRYRAGQAFSDPALRLEAEIEVIARRLMDAMSSWLHDRVYAIESIRRDCQHADWDGYGGDAVSHATYREALELLAALPVTSHPPEITAGPGGEIGFEWYRGRHVSFLLTVDGTGVAVYSGLFPGGETAHGEVPFRAVLPSVIRFHLERFIRP